MKYTILNPNGNPNREKFIGILIENYRVKMLEIEKKALLIREKMNTRNDEKNMNSLLVHLKKKSND